MGTCCSKIDSKNECGSFHGALHASNSEQWQAGAPSTCEFCQLNRVAGHLRCCICDACRKSAPFPTRRHAHGTAKGLANSGEGSYHDQPRCSLCVADAYEAELHGAPRHISSSSGSSSPAGDDDDDDEDDDRGCYNQCLTKQDLTMCHQSGKHGLLLQGHHAPEHDVLGHQYASSYDADVKDSRTTHEDFTEASMHARPIQHDLLLLDSTQQTLFEADDTALPPSRPLASSCKEGQDVIMFSNIAAYEFLSTSMRLARSVSIDDSDGIKLEVRYKHMLPHEVERSSVNYVSLVGDDHALKRARSSDKLTAGDNMEANRSIRRRKSFQIDLADPDLRYECEEAIMSEVDHDFISGDDEDFHDITVGVSISSLHTDSGCTINGSPESSKRCLSVYDPRHSSVPMDMNLRAQDGLSYITNRVGMLNLSIAELDLEPVYLLSKENMQFISKEEKEWEVRAEAMGMEDKSISRSQALSVVSTGDAILFSGANADEFHLIPSLFVQHPKSPGSSPIQDLSPKLSSPRLTCSETDTHVPEKSALSVEDIIVLLENDALNEDDLFSLLIDSCTKSSPSSSPCSSSSSSSSSSASEASMVWSSPLSSTSSASSSMLSSSVSSSTGSMPWLPSSSTSMLQLPPSSTTCSSSLPYSLSLPASCKMSPHTSFEFKVKSSSSTPSTPVFSPIRSRNKRNVAQLKPNTLTTGEIAEIWGLFEQRQACVSKQ